MNIVWDNPPPAKRIMVQKYKPFYDALKKRPGVWAIYPGSPSSVGAAKRYDNADGYHEVCTRKVNGKIVGYVRYMRY